MLFEMATITTRLTALTGCRIPIMGAPMAGVSGGSLAAAVQRAGGLAFIAAGHLNNPEGLAAQVGVFHSEAGEAGRGEGEPQPMCGLGFIGYSSMAGGNLDKLAAAIDEHKPTVCQFFAPAICDGGANVKVCVCERRERDGESGRRRLRLRLRQR